MTMRIDILTLFPDMFETVLGAGIVGRAISAGIAEVKLTNIRDFADNSYGTVDDATYGGGPGMVMMCGPVFKAVESVRAEAEPPGIVVLLTPQGRRMDQELATELARQERL
ncbi:MAG: tRNA (guanosine(37)-N1)-methyltransferase TrmD, partial [Phycisphaerae bacterium]|nr:tRNA (guanosine(37)-N1)-methyltransferase TrmD [Phycisphaerae bacterium]